MEKRSIFTHRFLPYALLLPQIVITFVFFYWPASQAVWQSFLLQDAFGLSTNFVVVRELPRAVRAARLLPHDLRPRSCSPTAVAVLSLSIALLLAVQADKQLRGRRRLPHAADLALCGRARGRRRAVDLHVPALARRAGARPAHDLGVDWNPLLNGNHAMIMVVLAATWKQISYNFLFFLAGLAAIPRSVIEAAAIDGARPMRRFWTIIFPLLSPTTFFLLVVNIVYAFFDTFGIIDAMTGGGPSKATETLVYKVYADGRLGGDLGGSAAQSVILMIIVIGLTAIQFRYVETQGDLLMPR